MEIRREEIARQTRTFDDVLQRDGNERMTSELAEVRGDVKSYLWRFDERVSVVLLQVRWKRLAGCGTFTGRCS